MVSSQQSGSSGVRTSVRRGRGDGILGSWSHQVQVKLAFAGLSSPGSLPTPLPGSSQHLLQPGPPPHPLLE